jgi:hypothetical protein
MTPHMPEATSQSANTSIHWSALEREDVVDGLGRTFNWTKLKGKTIYLCGHGAHLFSDGYCRVPPGTTVNFYQTYGKGMLAHQLRTFLRGETKWEPERTFTMSKTGPTCPNMTLLDDDPECIENTEEDVWSRVKKLADPFDHFIFNCNQFHGLKRYIHAPKVGSPTHKFNGKQILTLSEILKALPGNTFEWVCCQDLLELNTYNDGGEKEVTWGKLEETLRTDNSNAVKNRIQKAGFSPAVKIGLMAAVNISEAIRKGYHPNHGERAGMSHVEGTIMTTVRPEVSGGIRRPQRPGEYLDRRRIGIVEPERLKQRAEGYLKDIKNGAYALRTEFQADPRESDWAGLVLERGRVTAINFLRQLIFKVYF